MVFFYTKVSFGVTSSVTIISINNTGMEINKARTQWDRAQPKAKLVWIAQYRWTANISKMIYKHKNKQLDKVKDGKTITASFSAIWWLTSLKHIGMIR